MRLIFGKQIVDDSALMEKPQTLLNYFLKSPQQNLQKQFSISNFPYWVGLEEVRKRKGSKKLSWQWCKVLHQTGSLLPSIIPYPNFMDISHQEGRYELQKNSEKQGEQNKWQVLSSLEDISLYSSVL